MPARCAALVTGQARLVDAAAWRKDAAGSDSPRQGTASTLLLVVRVVVAMAAPQALRCIIMLDVTAFNKPHVRLSHSNLHMAMVPEQPYPVFACRYSLVTQAIEVQRIRYFPARR